MKYEQMVDRFFRENTSFVKDEQLQESLHHPDYFLNLMEVAMEYYYFLE